MPCNILQVNPELRETVQNNSLMTFKRNQNVKETTEDHTIKNLIHFKETEKENVNLVAQINQH